MSKPLIQPLVRFQLRHGLTVLVQPLPVLASVSIGLNVATGSRDEIPQEAGLSHLTEHMLFQGTTRRSVRELSRVLTAVGGNLDAATGRESTTYYAKVQTRHVGLAMDVLADMVQNPRLRSEHLEKEKHVVYEEIRMSEDTPDEWVHDLFFQSFWPRHALGRSILGTRANLLRVQTADLRAFMRQHYHPGRMVLAVAGRVVPEQVRRWAERYFGAWAGAPAESKRMVLPPPIPMFRPIHQSRPLEQVHVCLGVEGIAYEDRRRMLALAFSHLLGGSTNSRLFYEIRERRALAYTIYSFADFYRDTGMVGIYFACHPRKLNQALSVVRHELKRLAMHPISDQELQDLREHMEGSLLLSLESSSAHMWNIIQQETYLHQHPALESVIRSIRRLSKSSIQKIAQALFLKRPFALAILGPASRTDLDPLLASKTLVS